MTQTNANNDQNNDFCNSTKDQNNKSFIQGPNYFADMIINTQIAKYISSFDLTKGITTNNVILLMTLFSLSELKGLCKILYGEIGTLFKENYKTTFFKMLNGTKYCFNSMYYGVFWWKNPTIKLNIQEQMNMVKQKKNHAYYEIDTMVEFSQGLINILNEKNNEIYTNHTVNKSIQIEFQNMETEIIKEIWSDIYIEFEGITIKLNNILKLSFRNNKEKKLIDVKSIKYEKTDININSNDINYVHQLIDDPIISAVIECLHKENKNNYNTNHDTNYQLDIIKNIDLIQKLKLDFYQEYNLKDVIKEINQRVDNYLSFEKYVLMIIKYHYPNLILGVSLFEILFVVYLVKKSFDLKNVNLSFKKIFIKDKKLNFLDLELEIPEKIYEDILSSSSIIYSTNKYLFFNWIDNIIFNTKLHVDLITNYSNNTNTIFSKYINKILDQNQIKSYNYKNIINFNSHEETNLFLNSQNDFVRTCTNKSKLGLNNDIIDNVNNKTKTTLTNNNEKKIILNFECSGFCDMEKLSNIFEKFVKHVKSLSNIYSTNNTHIDIFKIKLIKEISEIEEDNPEYKKYEERKKLLLGLSNSQNVPNSTNSTNSTNLTNKSNNDNNKQKSLEHVWELELQELKQNIPVEKIKKETVIKKIDVSPINKGYKNFDTLYLREKDEKKLITVLSKFKSNKELLEELGLPNKCNILLSGLPGTGKSSTILTIASYLKKNIYYLSFDKTIETNDDLHKIFEHVINNCNGGIIVVEDIDAEGTFVHKRKFNDEENLNSTKILETKDNKLSLAYLLNLLQGTITPDGLIFIATTNYLERLDEAFYRDGRFDVKIDMKLADRYQINKIYKKLIGRDIPNNLLEKIQNDKFTPATIIHKIKDYISEEFTDEEILEDLIINN